MTALFEGKGSPGDRRRPGIGRAVAIELAAGGAQVALLARSLGQLDEAADAVRANGGIAAVLQADVADPGAVADAAERPTKELGAVDILVNNAAVVQPWGRPSQRRLQRGPRRSPSTSAPRSTLPRRSRLRCSIGGGVGS
jgi:NAD(P)-dependent dehydrogenase (short-subunit alcohol dehydrogenase family)